MSVESEILRIQHNVADTYAAVAGKGGTVPTQPTSANLAAAVESIPGSGASSGEVYSTEEQVIGTWIDGKPLYRKVTVWTTPNNAGEYTFGDAIPNVDVIAEIRACGLLNNGYWSEFPYVTSSASHVSIQFKASVNKLSYWTDSAVFTNAPVYVEMKYTKTTDQATIELPTALTVNKADTAMNMTDISAAEMLGSEMNYAVAATAALGDGPENEEM